MTFIFILIICLLAFALYKQSKANDPFTIIDSNELKAYNAKQTFEKNLKAELDLRTSQLKKIIDDEGIKIPKLADSYKLESAKRWHHLMDNHFKLLRKNKMTKDLKRAVDEIYYLKDAIVPSFEQNYLTLKVRYKADIDKLVELSDDYRDWYFQHSRLFDPMNYELWNDDSYSDRVEAKTIIDELNKKLYFDMGWDRMNKYYGIK